MSRGMGTDMTTTWIANGLSPDLPRAVVMHGDWQGVELAIWRSATGRLSAWKDRCPHRGACGDGSIIGVERRRTCGEFRKTRRPITERIEGDRSSDDPPCPRQRALLCHGDRADRREGCLGRLPGIEGEWFAGETDTRRYHPVRAAVDHQRITVGRVPGDHPENPPAILTAGCPAIFKLLRKDLADLSGLLQPTLAISFRGLIGRK